MDLGKLDVTGKANAGFQLTLTHPGTGDKTDVYIAILGRDSETYRKLYAEQSRRRLQKAAKSGRFNSVSDEEVEKDTIALLAACTRAWGDLLDGKPSNEELLYNEARLPCTRENVIKVYTSEPWIREQVEMAIIDRANFS